MKAFIERIEMFPEKRKDGSWIKKIVFNFPVPVDGEEVKELPLETETTVETVVLLGRKMVDDRNIEYEYVDYEPKDNEYMRNTKGSATYAEIKSWIKEQYNVSVSNLYIAQVKDSCGFEKRENYNTGAEGHKVPQCPDEKRELIMEAFKHFRMI